MLALSLAIAIASTPTDATTLSRVFAKGEKDQYSVQSHLQSQDRPKGLETWIPTDFDLNYKFTSEVVDMLPDGVAKIHYLRPTISRVFGETYDAPAKTDVTKVNYDYLLKVSPANEIIGYEELAKKPAKAKWLIPGIATKKSQGDVISHYLDELIRMSVFFGPFESSLDYSPKLPLTPVKVGDTWKRTVGYQPQQLKGKTGQIAVQRIDYTYTYVGPVTSDDGKAVVRVTAQMSFNTDLAAYLNQFFEEDTGLRKLPTHLSAAINFDLEPKTLRTIGIDAQSEGGLQLFLSDDPENPVHETMLKGSTTVRLIGTKK